MSRFLSTALIIVAGMALPQDCDAATEDECAPYRAAIIGDGVNRPIPDALLENKTTAIRCLARSIADFNGRIEVAEINSEIRDQFLRATGAIRNIFASTTSEDELSALIKTFRDSDNLRAANVLSFGARSDNYNVRLNSYIILANTIGNTTVCVAIDHLYSPDLAIIDPPDTEKESHDTRGRANLLSAVSVVAPWAFEQNFDNISKVATYWDAKLPGGEQFKDTKRILANIKAAFGLPEHGGVKQE